MKAALWNLLQNNIHPFLLLFCFLSSSVILDATKWGPNFWIFSWIAKIPSISTGDFFVSQGNVEYVNKLIQSFSPSEVLYQKSQTSKYNVDFDSSYFSYALDDWPYTYDYSADLLINQFK